LVAVTTLLGNKLSSVSLTKLHCGSDQFCFSSHRLCSSPLTDRVANCVFDLLTE